MLYVGLYDHANGFVAIPPYRSGQFGQNARQWQLLHAHPSQSHHTDQGNSDEYVTEDDKSYLYESRNPTIQIRAIRTFRFSSPRSPRTESRNPTIQIRAIRTVRRRPELRVARESRNPTIQIRAIRTSRGPTATAAGKPCRNPTIQIRAIRTSSREPPTRAQRRSPVAIPPYRSGQFGPTYVEGPNGGYAGEVAIPPYRSGQFGQRPLQVTDSARLKVPSAVTSRKCSSLRCHRLDFLLLSRIVTRSSSSGSVSGRYLRAKMAKAVWHDFCQACFLPSPPTARSPVVKESSTTPACPDASLRSA